MMTVTNSSPFAAVVVLLILASVSESFSSDTMLFRRHNFNICPQSTSSLHAISNPLRRRRQHNSSTSDNKVLAGNDNGKRSNLIQQITDITSYKHSVVDEAINITVVRFYSHFCRSCRASEPHFFQLARDFQAHPVNFVEVPLTPSTKVLHEALDVPSLPWTHIYHPEAGLVEERKVSKKHIAEVRKALRCYVYGECDLEDAPADCRVVYGECAIDDFEDD